MAVGAVEPEALAAAAKRAAAKVGFDAAGVCDLAPIERGALAQWLAAGYGATMTYINRQAAKRREPARIVGGARRALVVLKGYHRPSAPEPPGRAARVARYAWGEDYHRVAGDALGRLADALVALGASRASTRWFVDAGPVPERELARRAGLGWLAKNTMLIHPRLGSYTLIGSVLTDLPMAAGEPFAADHCGTCRACLDACPAAAFPTGRVLDARRCISYLTIERRGPFSAEAGASIGDWLFGCDACQEICPWNGKPVEPVPEPRFHPRPEVIAPELEELVALNAEEFHRRYYDTAFERPGPAGIARNARQIIANRRRGEAG